MSQFTIFSRLPHELRDQIWDQAIRDDGPAAHFFTMYDPAVDTDHAVRQEKRVHATSGGNDPSYRVGLAAPHDRRWGEHSWTVGNVSAYMTDSGLWTACRASRRRMLWHFRPTATSSPAAPDPADELPASSTAPVTMPFRRDNGERQYLTIRPSEDLLCFQLASSSAISRQEGDHWIHLQNFPLFRWRRPGGGWESPQRMRHIAIEYDVEYLDEMTASWLRQSCIMAEDVVGLAGFWFINYRLERRYRPDKDRRARKTFRAAGGVEFVEVRKGDDEWWDRVYGPKADRTGCPEFEQAKIWNYMKKGMPPDQSIFDSSDESSDDTADERRLPLRYGVLACVNPGSAKHLPTKSEWISGLGLRNKLCAGMRTISSQ
ncbi:hypothetical protein SLS64_014225 [Diaporthe eres]|uniref:2EXR domain-containing protein n=1 Tax=Diaporthe eres TaxID=83184 RepID=A0ABR1PEC3_DIAER